MNFAALAQSQTLATLLQALSPTTALAAGQTVEARLLSVDGDGVATARIGDAQIALVLAGPQAKQAALAPGATLLLRIDSGAEPGAAARATLVEIRPPAANQPPAVAPTPRSATLPRDAQGAGAADAPAPTDSTLPQAPRAGAAASPATASGQPASTEELRPHSPPLSRSAQPPPAAIASPRATAGPLLGPALAGQDGLAPLFANLRALASGSLAAIPAPLRRLADQVLAQAVPVESGRLAPEALKAALQRSGLFLEARQSAGQPTTPQSDLKAGLQALRAALEPVVEPGRAREAPQPGQQQPNQRDTLPQPAPPLRDGPLTLQPIAEPTLTPGDPPRVIAATLLEQTDAALDRISLSQYASLPLEGARAEAGQPQRWLTEIPLAFHTGAAMLPLQIEKEPPRRDAAGTQGPLWRVRFALDVEPMGPLQGVVTLHGRSVGVTLWAEREGTSRMLRSASLGLEAALSDARFENGAIEIHTGRPRIAQATAGQFLDRTS